ncbi:hypothetical protein RI129_004779 [Pyrocoelia pectoralis]|uniref:RING-type domain-containing protein n=1 Tax=Pyrocoelia pectoralis TaxID=417401 RepID=A0AAN7VCZ9_9COLE
MTIPYQGLTFGAMLVVAVGTAIYYYFTNRNTPMFHQHVQAELHLPPLPGTSTRSRSNSEIEDSCSICLDRLRASSVKTLNCRHVFHEYCINPWIEGHGTCPICRRNV